MREDIEKVIRDTGAVHEGKYFFALKSKRVANAYIEMDHFFTYPRLITKIGSRLISPFSSCKVIAAPATGGIALIHACAVEMRILAPDRNIRTVWADKKGRSFKMDRKGFASAVEGKNVVIIDDIGTTGSSIIPIRKLVTKAGGIVIGASLILNRGSLTAESLGVPTLHSLVEKSFRSYLPGEHEMWGTWPMVRNIGHPEHFPDYPHWINL